MVHFTELRVFQKARVNIQDIAEICEGSKNFGDIHNQMKRAAVSVVSGKGVMSRWKPKIINLLIRLEAAECDV